MATEQKVEERLASGEIDLHNLSLDQILANPAIAAKTLGLPPHSSQLQWLQLTRNGLLHLQQVEEKALQSTPEAFDQRYEALIETPENVDVQLTSLASEERRYNQSKGIYNQKFGATPEQLGRLQISQQIRLAAEGIIQQVGESGGTEANLPAYSRELLEVVIYGALLQANEDNTRVWNAMVAVGGKDTDGDFGETFRRAYQKINPEVLASAGTYFPQLRRDRELGQQNMDDITVAQLRNKGDHTTGQHDPQAVDSQDVLAGNEMQGENKQEWKDVIGEQMRQIVELAAKGFMVPSYPMRALLEKVEHPSMREKVSGNVFNLLFATDLIGILAAFGNLQMADQMQETAVVTIPALILIWLMVNLGKAAHDAGVSVDN